MSNKMKANDSARSALQVAVDSWIEQARDVPIRDVPYSILHLISRYFPPQCEWKMFAAHLGIESIQTLQEIEGDAHMSGQWPSEVALMYFATTTTSNPPSFADLIELLQKKLFRIDALQKLEKSGKIKEFLNEWNQNRHAQPKDPIKFFRRGDDDNDLMDKLDRMVGNDKLSDILRNFAHKQTHKTAMLAPFDQNFSAALGSVVTEYTVNACQIIAETPKDQDQDDDDGADDFKALSVANAGVRVLPQPTVLLTYSSDADKVVPELVARFRDNGICVVAEHVLRGKGVLEINPIAAWESFFKQCHFVVPILSNEYLREVNRPDDTIQSQAVRFIYDLYTGKYWSDGCRNHIVRPLVMADVRPQLLRNLNPTLRLRWRLWQDLDKLVKLVKDGYEARVRRS